MRKITHFCALLALLCCQTGSDVYAQAGFDDLFEQQGQKKQPAPEMQPLQSGNANQTNQGVDPAQSLPQQPLPGQNSWQTTAQPNQSTSQSQATSITSQSPDKILSYLQNLKMPKPEKDALNAALQAFDKQDYEAGLASAKLLKDKIPQKIALWSYLKSEGAHAPAQDIEAFRLQNATWPSLSLLRKRAEMSLLKAPPEIDKVQAFFKDQPPLSAPGKIVLGTSYFMQGKKGLAKRYFSQAWRNSLDDPEFEAIVLGHFSELISAEDHHSRINRLLMRRSKDNKDNIESASRLEKFLQPETAQIVKTRMAVLSGSGDAQQLINALPESGKKDIGLAFAKARFYRLSNQLDLAWKTMLEIPAHEAGQMAEPLTWWQERETLSRLALKHRKYQIAYDLLQNQGQISGKAYQEAQFLSGWIALRYLSDAAKARQHFFNVSILAETPSDKARALYWLGRTAIAMKDTQLARDLFRQASDHKTTYYGQIAETSLGGIGSQITFPKQPEPNPAEVTKFFERETVKVISVAHHAGLEAVATEFFMHLADSLDNSGELVLLARLARTFGYPSVSVRISELAVQRGYPLHRLAYPSDLIRLAPSANDQIESGALLALIHVASAFDGKTQSPQRASGVMQILPEDAEKAAQKIKVSFNAEKLKTDMGYNMQLGQAHLKSMLERYQNSLVLALAAYHAGPASVDDWLTAYGDPRRNTDILDWIENIPSQETRNSIQEITANLQIYRSRLSESSRPNQIMRDLTQVNLQSQPLNKPNSSPPS